MLEAVNIVANRLQEYSKETRHKVSQKDLPPFQPKHFTSVVIIHHKKSHSRKEEIEFIANIQHKGKINPTKQLDDVGVAQTVKDFSEVFTKFNGTNDFPTAVLIEGAPGIGKTTLCKEIMFQWSSQNLLQCKKIMFSVFLRDPIAQCLQSLQDFVGYCCKFTEKINSIIEEYISFTAGKDIVVILDGYDELPENIRNNSGLFLVKLINQNCVELLKCTVVITSRLSVSAELHGIVDRRVEIMGFTENNRKEYIMQALENDSENVEKLLKYLEKNPTINAYCYIPLNMTILLSLFTEGRKEAVELPTTQTEINKTFIYVTISRSIKKTQKEPLDCSIANFEDIPAKYNKNFYELCQLAYNALHDDKIVFSKNEVQKFCKHLACSNDWSGLGLLKAVEFFNAKDGCFSEAENDDMCRYVGSLLRDGEIDLSGQTLSAVNIHTLDVLETVMISEVTFFHFMEENNTSFREIRCAVEEIAQFSITLGEDVLPLHVCNMTERPFQEVEEFVQKQLDLSYCEFKANDIIEMFKENTVNIKSFNFSGNHITETATGSMIQRFSNSTSLQNLSLSNCYMCETTLVEILKNVKHSLKHLDLSFNVITDKAAKSVADVIHKNTDLEHLNLTNCYVQENGLYLILKSLRTACNLKFIDLKSNPMNNNLAGELADYISNNHLLNHLSLSNCALQEEGFLKIADALKKMNVLIYFDISSNNITSEVGNKLIDVFGENSKLKHLDISECQWNISMILCTNMTSLKCLNCSGCKMDDEQAAYLSCLITINTNLEQLTLVNCALKPAGLLKVFNALKEFCTVSYLDISNNQMTPKVIEELAEVIHWKQIEHLGMSHCLQGENSSVVLTAIANSVTLQYLDLSYNDISDHEGNLVASAIIANNNLHHINLANNKFTTNGIKIILNATASIDLIHHSNIDSYSITDELTRDLEAVTVSNSGLESIALDEYVIQDIKEPLSACISKLVVNKLCVNKHIADNENMDLTDNFKVLAMVKNSLKHLDLSFNVITDKSAKSVADVIHNNPDLEHLNLSNCKLQEKGLTLILRAAKNASHLKYINLEANRVNDVLTVYETRGRIS
ncbi:protein NLRC3-like [Dysidea avara]|uniref:protein NLRC3-like n=1 Tax=Dysidea avara TaxID=196820 RepID=UPI00332C027A